jgi:hypothetical protein
MRAGLRAAVPYFLAVFAAGVAFGTLRALVLAPAVGPLPAVALEVPVMLAVSWASARWAVAHQGVPRRVGPRLVMGSAAFTLLLAAEVALGLWGFGQSPVAMLASYLLPEGMLGLAAQVAFALMPLALILEERLGY